MKAFLFPLAILASSAMAQTTSACGADYIVDACLSSENAKLSSCQAEDWGCMCAQWKNIITCYNNCPNDPRLEQSAGQRDIFCGYASQYPSSTPTAVAAAFTTANAQNTQNANADPSQSAGAGVDSGSATTTGDGPAKTNSAADLVLNAGGVLAAVAGVVAVVL